MNVITALITGTLSRDPQSRTTSKGTAMATASIAVEAGDGKPAYVGLLAFGDLAETLLQCAKGDAVSARGRLELNRWTGHDGQPREGWQLVADSLLAGPGKPAKAAKPPRQYQGSERFQAPSEPPPFNDSIAF